MSNKKPALKITSYICDKDVQVKPDQTGSRFIALKSITFSLPTSAKSGTNYEFIKKRMDGRITIACNGDEVVCFRGWIEKKCVIDDVFSWRAMKIADKTWLLANS